MGLGVWGRIHYGFEAQDRIGKVVKVGRQHVHITTFQLGTGKHDLSRVRTMGWEGFMMFTSE